MNIDKKGVLQRAELWNDIPVGRRIDTDLEGISRTCEYPDERPSATGKLSFTEKIIDKLPSCMSKKSS